MITRSRLRHAEFCTKHLRNLPNNKVAGSSFPRLAMSTVTTGARAQGRRIRISHVLSTLMVCGIGATAWGLYEFYMTLTMWPREVRGDLRAGLRAKQSGDMKLSLKHLERAWENVQRMPLSNLEPYPLRKLTGVAILYAEVLETEGRITQAFDVLSTAVSRLTTPSTAHEPPSPPASPRGEPSSPTADYRRSRIWQLLNSARMVLTPDAASSDTDMTKRAVAMGLKLGALAEELGRTDEEERWLSFSVTEALRTLRTEYELVHDVRRGFFAMPSVGSDKATPSSKLSSQEAPTAREMLRPEDLDGELGLPSWASITKTELAAPMERLAAFYVRQGETGNAILLYRVASNLLTSTSTKRGAPSPQEYCQALQIENAHMAIMMDLHRAHPEDEPVARDIPRILVRAKRLHAHAEAASQHGAAVSQGEDLDMALCEATLPAVLFNSGTYHEEEGQLDEALKEYTAAYMLLRKQGPREQSQWALESARRVKKLLEDQKSTQQSSESPKGSLSEGLSQSS